MKEKGILFKGEMVRAILDGRKTQTRRIVRDAPRGDFWTVDDSFCPVGETGPHTRQSFRANLQKPSLYSVDIPYPVGTLLYVKETYSDAQGYCYRADYDYQGITLPPFGNYQLRWKSAMFMPREASRIDLLVKEVRCQRLQEISRDDAEAEGIPEYGWQFRDGMTEMELDEWRNRSTIENFAHLWDSINAKPSPVYKKIDGKKVITHYESYPWEEIRETREHRGKEWKVYGNPFVFAYTFKQVKP